MKKSWIGAMVLVAAAACSKTGTQKNSHTYIPSTVFANTDSTSIVGRWILVATRHYAVPSFTDTIWIPVDTTMNAVVVHFNPDWSFEYSSHFQRSMFGYNAYKLRETTFRPITPSYQILSLVGGVPNPPPGTPPTFATLINPTALFITYMGVDTGDLELYYKTGP